MNRTLSQTQPLSLMISSRCADLVVYGGKQQPLEVLRRDLKARLAAMQIGGKQLFSVWIHEDESNSSASSNTWDSCLEKARDADVFLALYNGRAGWLGGDASVKDGVGICEAELSAAFNNSPAKVRTIQFKTLVDAAPGSPDERFQEYVRRRKFPGAQVATGEEALARGEELAAAIVLGLARTGVGVNSSGSYYAGEALEWSRMNFRQRRKAMTAAMLKLFREREAGMVTQPAGNVAVVRIGDVKVGFVCDSIPASMTTAAARELVGQPFLHDHFSTAKWEADVAGPVHVIACPKGVTESQAIRQLGFPDAVVVSPPFGVYVADQVQKMQMAFISNCRDQMTTRTQVQAFLNWLNEHGEAQFLVERAVQRRKLSDYIRELSPPENARKRTLR